MNIVFTVIAAVFVTAFMLMMRFQSSGRKRSPVVQLTRFRGNEHHGKEWRDAYERLPLEMTLYPVLDYAKDEAADGRDNDYNEAYRYEH